jgi:pyruvate formate lyase activating enzyme
VSDITGRIFEIQRFSIHDGPGIRTTVFLKGCPLRCLWCHNPEGVAPEPELSFLPDKCIGCRYCLSACSRQAHRAGEDGGHLLDRTRCVVCGECAKSCYSGALEVVGRDVTVEEALEEVLKDRTFYETSGGGMTLSGGEPLLQIDFTEALLARGDSVVVLDNLSTGSITNIAHLKKHPSFAYIIDDVMNRRVLAEADDVFAVVDNSTKSRRNTETFRDLEGYLNRP